MTPEQLPPGTKARIEADAEIKFPLNSDPGGYMGSTLLWAKQIGYKAGATAEASRYIPLLRFASCPEFLIENPALIKGKKPTDEDMIWALEKVQEFKTYEQSLKDKYAPAIEALEKIAKEANEALAGKLVNTEHKGDMALYSIKWGALEAIKNYKP